MELMFLGVGCADSRIFLGREKFFVYWYIIVLYSRDLKLSLDQDFILERELENGGQENLFIGQIPVCT